MEDERNNHNRTPTLIVASWLLLLTIFFLGFGYWATSVVYQAKMDSIEKHEDRMHPQKTEKDRTKAEVSTMPDQVQPSPSKILAGIYIDRIVEISTKATSWTVDFYIWFKWTDPELDLDKSFHVVDGEILTVKEKKSFQVKDIRYKL